MEKFKTYQSDQWDVREKERETESSVDKFLDMRYVDLDRDAYLWHCSFVCDTSPDIYKLCKNTCKNFFTRNYSIDFIWHKIVNFDKCQ